MFDLHIHGEGIVSGYARILTQGYLIIKGKTVLKKILSSCVGCLKVRMITSVSPMGTDETLLHSQTLPMKIVYMDLAGYWTLPVVRGEEATTKVWWLLLTCSWSRFVKIQVMTEVSARAVMESTETAMSTIGCGMPAVIYCDQGTQLLPMETLMTEGDLDALPDNIYHEVKNSLVKSGGVVKASTAFSPWKRGKVERLNAVTKKAIKQVGLAKSTFIEFHHMINRVENLINRRPLGGYGGIIEDLVLRPCDLIYPLYSKLQVNLNSELPKTSSKEADFMEEANQIFEVFKEVWVSLYLHDLRKTSTKRYGRHTIEEGDFVILLDRVRSAHIHTYGIITRKISDHLKIKIISRGAKIDKNYKIMKPATTVIVDRAPESLVLLSKQGRFFDPFSITIPEKKKKKVIKERWVL